MSDKTDENPKRPETKVPDSLAKSWLLAHGYEREVQKIEAEERTKKLNPVKREVEKE